MRQLTFEAFERARGFIMSQARPLEKALFKFRFERGGHKDIIDCLATFQNPDGGFGRALEPDFRSPSSSSLATGMAIRTLGEVGCLPGEPIMERAVAYLLSTFQEEKRTWRPVPLDVNSHPHAPWWHDHEGSLQRTFDDFRIIPRALIAAGLQNYASLVPADWLERLVADTVDSIESDPSLGGGGGSDLEYAIALAEARGLPAQHSRRLERRIRERMPLAIVSEVRLWGTYCLTPLRAVGAPTTIGADLIAPQVQANLDYLIETQGREGTWDPVWSWMGSYPEAWSRARAEWRGILTLDTLARLQAFGRLEG